jgi:hypothetical protein
MNKKFLAILMMAVFYFVFAGLSNAAEKAQGKAAPTITAHFAASEIRPGESWKVYLKASDPDGDMKYIVASVKQAGVGVYSASFTRIKEENRKELSGYVYLNTMVGVGSNSTSLLYYWLTLTVWVQDGSGNFSNPVEVPVTFGSRVEAQGMPPSGVYKEQDLGPIMVPLRTMSAEIGTGGFERLR